MTVWIRAIYIQTFFWLTQDSNYSLWKPVFSCWNSLSCSKATDWSIATNSPEVWPAVRWHQVMKQWQYDNTIQPYRTAFCHKHNCSLIAVTLEHLWTNSFPGPNSNHFKSNLEDPFWESIYISPRKRPIPQPNPSQPTPPILNQLTNSVWKGGLCHHNWNTEHPMSVIAPPPMGFSTVILKPFL